MSAALSVFKLSVQNVHQLQQHTIKVSFKMTGLPYQWTPVANHSISIARQSAILVSFGIFLIASQRRAPHMIIQWNWIEIWRIRWLLFMSESQFNYLFTLKNAHLSSNSYNFWMQPNIAMKFAGYVAWILLCKHCTFGEKIYYNSRDIEFFLGDYFFWRALYIFITCFTSYCKNRNFWHCCV